MGRCKRRRIARIGGAKKALGDTRRAVARARGWPRCCACCSGQRLRRARAVKALRRWRRRARASPRRRRHRSFRPRRWGRSLRRWVHRSCIPGQRFRRWVRREEPCPTLGPALQSLGRAAQLTWRSARLEPALRGLWDVLRAVGDAAPRVQRRIGSSTRERACEEWYANGPLGLEQGFTLARAPAGRSTGTLTLAMTLSGRHACALAGPTGRASRWRAPPAVAAATAPARATDARGHALAAGSRSTGEPCCCRVDTRGARYPLRIDPLIQQSQAHGGTGSEGADFGYSVALSADGNTALIGDACTSRSGAWVFTRSGSTWAQQGPRWPSTKKARRTMSAKKRANAAGRSVALSADGNTALIGAPDDNGSRGSGVGVHALGRQLDTAGRKLTGGEESRQRRASAAAWRFPPTATPRWSAARPITLTSGRRGCSRARAPPGNSRARSSRAAEEIGEGHFGGSVALSADGNTALVGGPSDNGDGGAAWVFTRSGTTWEQQGAKLAGGEEESGEGAFGYSVALSAFGNTALIGGPRGRRRRRRRMGVRALGHRPGSSRAQSSRAAKRRAAKGTSATASRSPQTARWRSSVLRTITIVTGPYGCSPVRARPGNSRARSTQA